jgi:hypothetical protein
MLAANSHAMGDVRRLFRGYNGGRGRGRERATLTLQTFTGNEDTIKLAYCQKSTVRLYLGVNVLYRFIGSRVQCSCHPRRRDASYAGQSGYVFQMSFPFSALSALCIRVPIRLHFSPA